jgi:hypothetical protein
MLQPSTRAAAVVAAELDTANLVEKTRLANIAMGISVGYMCLVPLLLAFGVRDAPYLCALIAGASVNLGIGWLSKRQPQAVPRIVTALGHALMFGLIARMATPFLVAPAVAAVTLMAYAQHPAVTRQRDLIAASVLALGAVLGVAAAEAVGLIRPTTFVKDGVLSFAPPLDGVSDFPIIPALCCYVIVVVIVAVHFGFVMARRGREARHRLHVQAWRLRQLVSLDRGEEAQAGFPGGGLGKRRGHVTSRASSWLDDTFVRAVTFR